jgi:hypothetical protein
MGNIFLGIPDNVVICMKSNETKINNEISRLKCPILTCSNNWKEFIKKIIYNSDNCTDDCRSEEKFEYEYYCYDKCPIGTHSLSNNDYLCKKNVNKCLNKSPFILTEDDSCALECSSEDFFNNKCKLSNYNIENKKFIINNIIDDIENGQMNGLISGYLTTKKDIIKKVNETIYQITSSWNQNNKKYNNISSIKLNKCENILKAKYNISTNKSLIIFKIEQKMEELLIPLIEYEIFEPETKEKLNLNHCINEKAYINIYIPVSINILYLTIDCPIKLYILNIYIIFIDNSK